MFSSQARGCLTVLLDNHARRASASIANSSTPISFLVRLQWGKGVRMRLMFEGRSGLRACVVTVILSLQWWVLQTGHTKKACILANTYEGTKGTPHTSKMFSRVTSRRAPLAPIGCPKATAPPWTFTLQKEGKAERRSWMTQKEGMAGWTKAIAQPLLTFTLQKEKKNYAGN